MSSRQPYSNEYLMIGGQHGVAGEGAGVGAHAAGGDVRQPDAPVVLTDDLHDKVFDAPFSPL